MSEELIEGVNARVERVRIPTYPVGEPQKNPLFLEGRVYQGSSGVVYPYPVIDSVGDDKAPQTYNAIILENEYLKVMILPELGGRVQMATDKTNGYQFIYYNQVIKPALVGLAGPWISGGIEFNWPQHHRPTTFSPMDYRIVANEDGSQTAWCSEIEPMFNTRGMHGFTLHPGKAYLQIDVQLHNRSSEPQTFLWWANPAVHVNDDYQSIFPPDVHAVFDHGKRDVSEFPIATGTYYKVDYSPGTDISRYKNIPVPTSYMAYHSDYNFIGCYDHGQAAGMMHVANHHLVPGKKQWTWGKGDFGIAWDRQLTDEDGPYIELMCGAFTDNQPDFSWLMPGEEKRFQQIFMPFKEIGGAKNASAEAVLNLEVDGDMAQLGVYVTASRTVQLRLRRGDQVLYEELCALTPAGSHQASVSLPAGTLAHELHLSLHDGERELLAYRPAADATPPIPQPATPTPPPETLESGEALFLNGLHLEQYRHATYRPEPYYEEALRRDPLDSRCNNALGLLLYRAGQFAAAEPYFRAAIKGLTRRNPNPYDGEPLYNLGLTLRMQGRYEEAFDAFYKAVWNAAWQAAGYFELARLASRAGRYEEALRLATDSLHRNWLDHRARHLRIALLRRTGRLAAARREVELAFELDPLNYGATWEQRLLGQSSNFDNLANGRAHTYIELALNYAHSGLYDEAVVLLSSCPEPDTMLAYYLGWVVAQSGDTEHAQAIFSQAAGNDPDFVFPNRLEAVLALQMAQDLNPDDPFAPHYLGNFWYAHRQYEEAIDSWERTTALAPDYPTAWRNLGLAYFNKRQDAERALVAYEKAFALDKSDSRVLFELDQLYKALNRPVTERMALLANYPEQIAERDDLTLEWITLLNLLDRPLEALAALQNRRFHPWEGGEGKTTGQYVLSLVELARAAIANGKYEEAIELLTKAQAYPDNLGEGKLIGAQENHIFYYLGRAYDGLDVEEKAREAWRRASQGSSEPTSAMYYNDQPPEMIFYQGLARQRLDDTAGAEAIFRKLLAYGQEHLDDEVVMDYFAVSLPDFAIFAGSLTEQNQLHCLYMMALGQLGLGDTEAATALFGQILARQPHHLGATAHRRLL